MALELVTLISAVNAISSLVKETGPIVQSIRSGVLARNEAAKGQLAERLEQLQQSLQHASELANVAEVYTRTHENTRELLWLCRRAERFLKDCLDECRNRDNPNYAGNWKVLDAMFETIDSNRDAPRKVVMARGEWYDEKDKYQIELLLQQFTMAYERASAHLRGKVADDLLHELQGMTRPLQDAEALLQDTIYERILRTLQKLGA